MPINQEELAAARSAWGNGKIVNSKAFEEDGIDAACNHDTWWEQGVNPTDVSDVNQWPFGHLFREKCGPIVWIAGELQHA